MARERFFGTDGIRGVVNEWPMTPEFVLRLGRALSRVLRDEKGEVVVAKDTRESGDLLEAALSCGLASGGTNVLLADVLPTPGVAYLAKALGVSAGVVISASHNPCQDNGLKFFGPDGIKLSPESEREIEEMVRKLAPLENFSNGANREIGRIKRCQEVRSHYFAFLKNSFRSSMDPKGLKVVVDCANGALSNIAFSLFGEFGLEVIPIRCTPNGRNINHNCGSLHPEVAARTVRESGADVGFAFDGDGDRVIAIDEQGGIIDGDRIIAISAKFMKEKGELRQNLVVVTLMSNIGLEVSLKKMGIKMTRTQVGDRYVLEKMKECGAVLGGEQSGHVIYLNENTTGDGALTAIKILSIMGACKAPLSELAKTMTSFPQILLNIRVKEKPLLEEIANIQTAIKDAENELGQEGRVLVRYSGTEPLCRVMVEGPTKEKVSFIAHRIAAVVEKEIG